MSGGAFSYETTSTTIAIAVAALMVDGTRVSEWRDSGNMEEDSKEGLTEMNKNFPNLMQTFICWRFQGLVDAHCNFSQKNG